MPFLSVTRLRLRSARFLPAFAWHAWRSLRQVRSAPGFAGGSLLPDRHRTFWTLTCWNSEAEARTYIRSDSHGKAMPRLMHWCDEASVVHWAQAENTLPSWTEAEVRMRTQGRPSKVLHPTARHRSLTFVAPAHTRGASIVPRPEKA